MDERTRGAYEVHAAEFVARDQAIPSPLRRYFQIAFGPAANPAPRILDIGAGSGREVAALAAEKYEAYGVEPVEKLREALFTQVTPDELQLLFERVGFVALARWTDEDALRRAGPAWTTLLLERSSRAGTRQSTSSRP